MMDILHGFVPLMLLYYSKKNIINDICSVSLEIDTQNKGRNKIKTINLNK